MPEFNPEMLVLARESRGLTQSQLARMMRVDQGTVSRLEAGILQTTDMLTQKAALSLEYPESFFMRGERIYGFNSSVFFHRKRHGLSDKILRKLHALVNIARFEVSKLLRAAEIDSPQRFERIAPRDYRNKIDHIAQVVRSTWLLPLGPVANMMHVIEDAGGVVFTFDFGTDKIDAISEWVPGTPPLFCVNSNPTLTGDRARLTLAHEVGHIIMHQLPTPTMETEANQFAAEFLMPASEIKTSLHRLSIPKLAELKAQWKVSMAALVQRALQLGTISEAQHKRLFIQLGQYGYRLREPIETDIPIEQPQLVRDLIATHLNQLGFKVQDLSKFLNLREEEFRAKHLPDSSGGLRLVG